MFEAVFEKWPQNLSGGWFFLKGGGRNFNQLLSVQVLARFPGILAHPKCLET
jgi:hypothetical protein